MKRQNTLYIALALLLAFSLPSHASDVVKPVTAKADAFSYCPAVSTLKKEGMTWRAPNNWRSYSDSFVKEAKYFLGAQWVGIKVGKIICLYKGDEKLTFPVALERNDVLINAPTTNKNHNWQKDRGGYMECRSTDVKDCPFTIIKPPPKKDIYEQLDFYKQK